MLSPHHHHHHSTFNTPPHPPPPNVQVGQLKTLLEAKGVECRECVEKGDYVNKIKEAYGVAA